MVGVYGKASGTRACVRPFPRRSNTPQSTPLLPSITSLQIGKGRVLWSSCDLVRADDDGDLANNMAGLVCREGCRGVGQGELLENMRTELLEGCDG